MVILDDVLWIGGGPAAGKSSLARRLAAQHGLTVYSTDAVMAEHADRLPAEEAPELAAFARMSPDQRWVLRSPSTMLETFHWFRGEGFRLIVEDLLALPTGGRVVAEGFRLLPALVSPLLGRRRRGLWLLPSAELQRRVVEGRAGGPDDVPGRTSDPERARRNLLERDQRFTQWLSEEVRRFGLRSLRVDSTTDEASTARMAEDLLDLGAAPG